jgi:prophage antirepressor-like protein|nr:MAG TPA: repressor domain protein [Caudoviricetes sp.]
MNTTAITTFNNEEFGNVRTLTIDGDPWFVGKDIAECLGYSNTKDALRKHVDSEDKIMGSQNATPSITDNLGRKQFPTFINESGVYSLILGSKLESAKKFKRWVTSEVLPSLRKTGTYTVVTAQPSVTSSIIVQSTSDIELPKATNTWYLKNRKRIRELCDLMDIERRTLYHLILTEIGKAIDIEQSKSIYTRDHGFPPEFIMDVVGYFTKMQEIADEYLDRLLEKYESLDSDNDEEDESVW